MLARLGFASRDALVRSTVPAPLLLDGPLALPPPVTEAAALAELRALAHRNEVWRSLHRHRLPRHDHPGADPAQRVREPGLVHRLHALPGRGRSRAARGAAELPADGRRAHRPAGGQCIAARRGHRGRRGDGRLPARVEACVEPVLRRRRHASAGACGDGDPCALDGHRAGARRRRVRPRPRAGVRRAPADARHRRAGARLHRGDRGDPRGRRAGLRRHRSAGAGAAEDARRHGRRRRDRFAQRFGVPLGYGGPHAAFMAGREIAGAHAAGPDHRRLEGRRRQPGAAHGAADPRAAHPPREGHQQHLHRAGAAGEHGLVLRGLPWPAGPARASRCASTRWRACWPGWSRPLPKRQLARARTRHALLRHAGLRPRPRAPSGRTRRSSGRRPCASTCAASATDSWASAWTRRWPWATSPTSPTCSPACGPIRRRCRASSTRSGSSPRRSRRRCGAAGRCSRTRCSTATTARPSSSAT